MALVVSDCLPSPRSDTFPPFMQVGVPKEIAEGEHRVALVPEVVAKLKTKGIDVLVESGAGADALLPDSAFADAGAQLSSDTAAVWRSDVVVKISPPSEAEVGMLGPGSILIGFLAPLTSPQTTSTLASAKATAFAMESIPRISRARRSFFSSFTGLVSSSSPDYMRLPTPAPSRSSSRFPR